MTRKLYDENAYETKFEGKVLECEKIKDQYRVLLDQTLFFPEEGGQSCDRGTLAGLTVLDVQIKDNEVYHFVDCPLEIGSLVKGEIDFSHRFSNMQLHSGEHIFSGLVYKTYGFNNVGFHLSDNRATIDVGGTLTYEDVMELERRVNQIIVSNVEIKCSYPEKDKLDKLMYRSKKELSGPIRIVEIPEVDICACCAPHVKRTGEIGLFKVINFENYKGGVRIYYLCGFRALNDYELRISELREISRLLSAKTYEEPKKVKELFDELNQTKIDNVNLIYGRIENEIKEEAKKSGEGIHVGSLEEAKYMRRTMDMLHNYYEGTCYLFCGNDEAGYRYLIENDNEDISYINKILKDELGAKGGGKPNSLQGSVSAKIDKILFCV